MKPATVLLLLIISFHSFAQAQTEIVRKPLSYPTHSFFKSETWADEDGYLLIRFQHSTNFNAFRFIHREKGELSSFANVFILNEIFGYTSTASEFTIYFKGYALDKRGYYFLTFFKNSDRAPVLNTWMDKSVEGNSLFSYSAFGKLYILKEGNGKLNLVEVTDYGKSRVIPFQTSKDQLKKMKIDRTYFKSSYPEATATGKDQNLLCYKDSVVVIVEGKSSETFKRFTRLIKFDYSTGMIRERQVLSPVPGLITSKILGDRFYQLRFGTEVIGLGVYQYPSLKLLHEFKYADGENITIKTSPLLRLGGKTKEDNWDEEKRDRKVMNELLKGEPNLSVQQDSTNTKMLIESRVIAAGSYAGNPATSGGGGVYSPGIFYPGSDYLVGFDACFSTNGDPCPAERPKTAYYRAAESFNQLEEKNQSDNLSMIENSFYVYSIHVSVKTKEYFVEEFKK